MHWSHSDCTGKLRHEFRLEVGVVSKVTCINCPLNGSCQFYCNKITYSLFIHQGFLFNFSVALLCHAVPVDFVDHSPHTYPALLAVSVCSCTTALLIYSDTMTLHLVVLYGRGVLSNFCVKKPSSRLGLQ